MKRLFYFTAICFLLGLNSIIAQDEEKLKFYIDFPAFEYPYNLDAEFPTASMEQSIRLTKSFYFATHFGIEHFGKKRFGRRHKLWSQVIMTVFDFAPIPLSNTWLHEESHRAILSINNIKSRNAHWSNSVKGVDDIDLINFKALRPADITREATAGNEGNLEFVLAIQKDMFYDEVNTWNYGLYWGNYLVNSFYLFGSTRPGSEPLVRFKHSEDSDVHKRDVNGFDPINATYDMFNPFVEYTERGIHPSGEGVDRYIEFNDLSLEAQGFLKNQFALSLLNFVDLNLFGVQQIGKNVKYNFSLRHHMTSFGSMVGANIFFKTDNFGGFIHPKVFRNKENTSFGLDLELRYKMGLLKLSAWQQPENLLYHDTEQKTGGLIQLSLAPKLKHFTPYIDLNLKSAGWVPGNPYLDKNFNLRVGLRKAFHEK